MPYIHHETRTFVSQATDFLGLNQLDTLLHLLRNANNLDYKATELVSTDRSIEIVVKLRTSDGPVAELWRNKNDTTLYPFEKYLADTYKAYMVNGVMVISDPHFIVMYRLATS